MTKSVKTPVAKKSNTKKSTPKRIAFKDGERDTRPEVQKLIIKRINGTATPVKNERGQKVRRLHKVKYTVNDKRYMKELQQVNDRERGNHKRKNIYEQVNSKGAYRYYIPEAK